MVITPNRVEALALAGHDAGRGGRARLGGLRLSLEGDGAGGRGHHPGIARLPGRRRQALRPIPAPRVEAVDTVGAGDAFNGALAVALAEGRSLDEAAAWANAAAALAVTQPGAQAALPFRDAIDRLAARGKARSRA